MAIAAITDNNLPPELDKLEVCLFSPPLCTYTHTQSEPWSLQFVSQTPASKTNQQTNGGTKCLREFHVLQKKLKFDSNSLSGKKLKSFFDFLTYSRETWFSFSY